MACRNVNRGEEARKSIENELNWSDLSVLKLDLADLSSVREFTRTFIDREERLDILINNAGLMAVPYQLTNDGFEMQFGVNYLGHFALTGLLYPILEETPGARVINMCSLAYLFGRLDFGDLQSQRKYRKWGAYGQSKLAMLHFTSEFNRREIRKGGGITVLSAHPGYASTKLILRGPEMEKHEFAVSFFDFANRVAAQPASKGILPALYAASSENVEKGGFYGPDGLIGLHGYPVRIQPKKGRVNADDAKRLWDVSMNLTGIHWLD